MALALAGLADALRAAGLVVVEFPGWKERTQRDGPFTPRGVMIHHDASALGDSPGVPAMMANLANDGAQCWVDRHGVWHLVAAGRMWHAGLGTGFGVIPANDGNTYSVGVESDHTTGEDWPVVQYHSLVLGTAVIVVYLGKAVDVNSVVCGHKEYRRSNPDPDGIDMDIFREGVHNALHGAYEGDEGDGMDRVVKGKDRPDTYVVSTTADGQWKRHIDQDEAQFLVDTGVRTYVVDQVRIDRIKTRSATAERTWNYEVPVGLPQGTRLNPFEASHRVLAHISENTAPPV